MSERDPVTEPASLRTTRSLPAWYAPATIAIIGRPTAGQ
jgi:hypothetical protein